MTLNPGKSHYVSLRKNLENNEMLNFTKLTLKNSKEVQILGIKIDNNLTLNNHIKSISGKAGQKSSAILKISSNFNMRQKKIII